MAGAGLHEAYNENITGPRLGRAADGGNPSAETRASTIDEMGRELLMSGSVLAWFVKQFWRLRYAGSSLLIRHRLVQQLDHVKQCLNVDLLPVPVRPAQGVPPTHAQ
eukprot:2578731-Heterocapsa_arctica.AAC.1